MQKRGTEWHRTVSQPIGVHESCGCIREIEIQIEKAIESGKEHNNNHYNNYNYNNNKTI